MQNSTRKARTARLPVESDRAEPMAEGRLGFDLVHSARPSGKARFLRTPAMQSGTKRLILITSD